ncbi:DUF5132 domain-containing protein [Massilia horti]|uniref:DUF5132 domain-containing protein n=1 Tax=Massilia horti TaxID=2562153 RepID=A0A4Y9SR28_9BURK|nr:DUF5132 domain-containing protein [Massilia horti]TFW27937.1 DUF5132 domain-containing protein [Massilia horti]
MDILKSNVIVGVSAALAATVLVPVLLPVVVTVGRPVAKSLLKGGLMLYEKGREAVAVAGESVEDMMAEIRAEQAGQGAPAPEGQAAAGTVAPHAQPDQADRGPRPRPGMAAI